MIPFKGGFVNVIFTSFWYFTAISEISSGKIDGFENVVYNKNK